MSSERLSLPNSRLCLFCNSRERAGTDDLCDACTDRWSQMPPTKRPFVEEHDFDDWDAHYEPNVLEYHLKRLLKDRT